MSGKLGRAAALLFALCLLAACVPAPAPTPTPVYKTTADPTRTMMPKPTPLAWVAPASAITASNAANLARVGSLVEHAATVNNYSFAHKRPRLLTRDGLSEVWVWDLDTGKALYKLANPNSGLAFYTPDDSQIVTVNYDTRTVATWDAETGKSVAALTLSQNGIVAVVAADDGSALAVTERTGAVSVWRPATARGPAYTIPAANGQPPAALAFTPDSTLLFISGSDFNLRAYDAASGALRKELTGFGSAVAPLRFSQDSKLLAAATGTRVFLIDIPTFATLGSSSADDLSPQKGLEFSPDGKRLAVGGSLDVVYVFDVLTRTPLAKLPGQGGQFSALAWSPDGSLLMTVAYSPQGGAFLWAVESLTQSAEKYQRGTVAGTPDQMYNGAWSPDGKRLFIGDGRGPVLVFGNTRP